MLPNLSQADDWRLLTPKNVGVRRLWRWGHTIQKIVAASEPAPVGRGNLLITSDYGGDHPRASHLIYCYLVILGDGGRCLDRMRSVRSKSLPNNRTMTFKRLSDPNRQQALIPYLEFAADLNAHLVAIAVDKRKKWLSMPPNSRTAIQTAFGLKARWNDRAFEAMMRKVHFVAILSSIWSRPYGNLTWITDQDEFVANDTRHDDALLAVGRMSSFYISHPMGVLRLNTTDQDPEARDYEDLCSIPDLAAGMLSEISTGLAKDGSWGDRPYKRLVGELSPKAETLADWFWDDAMPLRKTLITIDVEGTQFSVRKVGVVDEPTSFDL